MQEKKEVGKEWREKGKEISKANEVIALLKQGLDRDGKERKGGKEEDRNSDEGSE